jgi:hypothetical protein
MSDTPYRPAARDRGDVRSIASAWIATCVVIALAMGLLALATEPVPGIEPPTATTDPVD